MRVTIITDGSSVLIFTSKGKRECCMLLMDGATPHVHDRGGDGAGDELDGRGLQPRRHPLDQRQMCYDVGTWQRPVCGIQAAALLSECTGTTQTLNANTALHRGEDRNVQSLKKTRLVSSQNRKRCQFCLPLQARHNLSCLSRPSHRESVPRVAVSSSLGFCVNVCLFPRLN
jgi:hypothetical protein